MDYFKYDVVYAMNITDVDDKVNTVQYWGSGSVVECLSQDQKVAGSSLTGATALCP